jgi:hypothetical protein
MQNPESPNECCADLSAKFDEWKECAERSVREEPMKTAGLAFLAGLILTILPVSRILAGLVQVAFSLVRPVLLILGVVKVIEEIEHRNRPARAKENTPRKQNPNRP